MSSRPGKRLWILIIALILLSAVVGYWYRKESRSVVLLRPHGKATFYRGGFFHRDEFELARDGGKWQFFGSEPLESGELIVPFECPYNEYRTLRLEGGGKVYVLDNDTMSRYELRVVNGEWSYEAVDHWQSIFDPW